MHAEHVCKCRHDEDFKIFTPDGGWPEWQATQRRFKKYQKVMLKEVPTIDNGVWKKIKDAYKLRNAAYAPANTETVNWDDEHMSLLLGGVRMRAPTAT